MPLLDATRLGRHLTPRVRNKNLLDKMLLPLVTAVRPIGRTILSNSVAAVYSRPHCCTSCTVCGGNTHSLLTPWVNKELLPPPQVVAVLPPGQHMRTTCARSGYAYARGGGCIRWMH